MSMIPNIFRILQENGITIPAISEEIPLDSIELDLDSVQFLEVFVDLENEFNIIIRHDELTSNPIQTLQGLVNFIEQHINTRLIS